MPITDSRLKTGTLTLEAAQFASQATNVRVTPSTDEVGDELETLSGDTIAPDDETTAVLNITAVQDFDDPAGFIRFSWDNAGDIVTFTWQPNAGTMQATGTVRVRPVEVGGDVNARLTTSASWPIVGLPTWTWPTA